MEKSLKGTLYKPMCGVVCGVAESVYIQRVLVLVVGLA